jgi:hypothetical protein
MARENNAVVITAIIAAVILIIAFGAFYFFTNSSSDNSVSVQGMSTIKAVPNLVSVYFNIETKGTTSSEAKDANTLISNKLSDKIISLGFKNTDLQTISFSVSPNYDYNGNTPKQNGFIAVHSLKIELPTEKMDKLTSVIDAGIDSGAGISYINFELTQASQNQYKAQALELASQDAKIKADSVAKGLGKNVGKLVSVSVNDFGYYPWPVFTAKAGGTVADAESARASTVNIQPSEQDISAVVSATFKLK